MEGYWRGFMRQAKEMQGQVPGFDMIRELQNPTFNALARDHVPLETAYRVVHMDELLSRAMAYTAQQVKNATEARIQNRAARPQENGLTGGAAFVTTRSVQSLSAKELADLEKRALQGEKIRW